MNSTDYKTGFKYLIKLIQNIGRTQRGTVSWKEVKRQRAKVLNALIAKL